MNTLKNITKTVYHYEYMISKRTYRHDLSFIQFDETLSSFINPYIAILFLQCTTEGEWNGFLRFYKNMLGKLGEEYHDFISDKFNITLQIVFLLCVDYYFLY